MQVIEASELAPDSGVDAVAVGQIPSSLRAARDDRLSGIRDLRGHVARGMLTNGIFQILLLALTAARGLAAAAFVSRADYGLWGLIGLSLWTAMGLKSQFGAGEKYVQQSDENQEHAFQRAFTMEVIFATATAPVAIAAVFIVEVASGNPHVIAPGLLLLLLLPATALQFPLSTLYRRMEFRRQRTIQAIEPLITAVVTIALAVAGAGYWSFVIGGLAGSCTLAVVVVRISPYRIALRYERGTLRQYLAFSLPLLVTGVAVLCLFYVVYLVGNEAIGIAGLGAFTLVGQLVQFTDQADLTITATLYPAICAVKERTELLSEIFVKSNRLSLIWAVPFGMGMALFASDLVRLVLGTKWLAAIPLLEIIGAVTAVHHVGYNWAAFVKARGTTWPIAVSAVLTTLTAIGVGIPLMYRYHLIGLGIAFAAGELVGFTIRGIWLARFFTGVRILTQLVRAFTPTALAACPILIGRALLGSERTLPAALAAFALYVILTACLTWTLERPLIREAAGYLLRQRAQAAPA